MIRTVFAWGVLIVLGAGGCGPALVWYGHSPDRRMLAKVIEQGDSQFVTVNDAVGPGFDGVALAGITFSSDSRHLAYPARIGERWTLVRDGKTGRLWDGIGEVAFTPDCGHLVYAALDSTRWYMILDDMPGPWFTELSRGSLIFSPSGSNIAYIGRRASAAYAVLGNSLGPSQDDIAGLRFTADGTALAYIGRKGPAAHLIVGNRISPPYEAIAEFTLNPSGAGDAYLAKESGCWYAFVGNVRWGPYDVADGFAFDRRGDRWVFVARRGGWDRLVFPEGEGLRHKRIVPSTLQMDFSGRHVAYVIEARNRQAVVVDSTPNSFYDHVEGLVFSSDGAHYAYIAYDAEGGRIVVDGIPGRKYDAVSDLVFSSGDGGTAYLARRGGASLVVVNGDTTSFDVVVKGSLVVDADRRHWAVLAGSLKEKKLGIYIDGANMRRPFDWEELTALLMRRPFRPMDLQENREILRGWIRAEIFLATHSADRCENP